MPTRSTRDLLIEHGALNTGPTFPATFIGPLTRAERTSSTGRYQTATIGPWQLYLNPTSYKDTTQRIHQTMQTANGYVRFSYGNSPTTYILQGTTGNAGVHGKGGINDLDQLRPQPGRPDKMHPFTFPVRFAGVRWVRINQVEVTQESAQSPYFYYYTIELEEYYKKVATSAMRVSAAVGLPPLPTGG